MAMLTRTRYRPAEIEKKWQDRWEREHIHATRDDGPGEKFYNLVMFPYPSGDLHIGHWYNFGPADTYARYQRMHGFNVLAPIGFDAFGLPAENAAIKRNIQPRKWTLENIEQMKDQLKTLGPMYDWDRLVVTCLPDYYKWTQWLFLQLYRAGLAYKTKAPANWCPHCNTTLANEQVVDGRCERCETVVTRRDLEQWFFRITNYADRLLDFSQIDWPERILTMQRNWIGRSEGAEVTFTEASSGEKFVIFTTRPDTLYGATFMVLAPEHPLVEQVTTPDKRAEMEAYVEAARHESEIERMNTEKEKTGVFIGAYAINPINNEQIPIWISDYVLMGYGTGAIMAVPAHDQRDFEFARTFNLPIRLVYQPEGEPLSPETMAEALIHTGQVINSGPFNGLPDGEETIRKFIVHLEQQGTGKARINYRIRDWLISRQRYWGAPIPIVYCSKDGTVPVPEEQLPVWLPDEVEFKPTGESPLRYVERFLYTTCPKCGGPATRETDTMDTFMCSSWYFLRYTDPHNDQAAWDTSKVNKWMPVDQYIGGAEHAVMHLLYSRFFVKALQDIKLLNFGEPFTRLFNQGIILGPDGQKMSKSRGNVVNPDEYVAKYGADTVRCYLMFMGPYDQGGVFQPQNVGGVARFLNRVWDIVTETIARRSAGGAPTGNSPTVGDTALKDLQRMQHKTIKKVGEDIGRMHFNTAVSTLMEYSNHLVKALDTPLAQTPVWEGAISTLLVLLAPLAPHITEELWELLGKKGSIHLQSWPGYDEVFSRDEVVTLVVQINGKVRDRLEIPVTISEEEVKTAALASEKVQGFLAGKIPYRVVYVPGRLINIVV